MACEVCGGAVAHWNKTGICTRTSACQAARARLHRKEHPEANTEAHARWRAKNRDAEREIHRLWVEANPGYVRPSVAQYRQLKEGMAQAQDYLCAICGRYMLDDDRYLDHDHSCCDIKPEKACGRCYRGVVHNLCNRWLGLAGDDPAVLLRAAEYLQAARMASGGRSYAKASAA